MYLRSIDLQGFKSFAKKSEFQFTAPITAIVGPNGSGKSNVAEAFRFVLGEQSIKTLRGKRGEDLIWNGSTATPKANRANVRIVFDNTSKFLQSDFDEVSIERSVGRDGVNQYSINDTQVRLKDIVELLAGANIGQSGHHIISQGEADRILSAHPRERKIMLEEALGLKLYHYKKDESLKKLEKTEENIAHVEGLRKEILPHLKFLKKQVEKVEKAETMRVELGGLYREYFFREEAYISMTKAAVTEEKAVPDEEMKRIEKELEKAKATMLKQSSADEKSKEVVELEESLSRVREEKEGLSRELGRIEGQVELAKRMAERALGKTEHAPVPRERVDEAVLEVEGYVQGIETEGDIVRIKILAGKIKEALSRLKADTHSGGVEHDRDAQELTRLEGRLREIEQGLTDKNEEESKLRHEYQTLKTMLESEKDENRAAERAVFELMAKKSELSATLAVLRGKLESLKLIEDEWKREKAEAAALAGRSAVEYADIELRDGGRVLMPQDLIAEPRGEQEARKKAIERIKIRLEEFGAGATEEIMREYKEVSERDQFLERETTDLHSSAESLKVLIADLEERLTREFTDGLSKINAEFSNFFSLMFGGGTASLTVIAEKKKKRPTALPEDEVMDESEEGLIEEEEEAGIEIAVNLPRKRIKSLIMLSGGERALTSIALIFAMSQVNPPPFVILDETDAALDEANSKRYGDMIENLAKKSQLIVITHNRETMSRAGVLYGVTMGSDGVSKLLSVKFEEAVAVAK